MTTGSGAGSGEIPYLGSKISLISKADIRYEGILYTIDTNESTVALAKVRTFGTEDRPVERPVPGRDEVFEYIIFRGKDIKDLHVCQGPTKASQNDSGPPQDPAIVKSSGSSVMGTTYGHTGYQQQQQFTPAMPQPQQKMVPPQMPPQQQQPSYGFAPQPASQPVVQQQQQPASFAQATSQPAQQQNLQPGSRGNTPPPQDSPSGDRGYRQHQQQRHHQDGGHNNQSHRHPRPAQGQHAQRGGRPERRGHGFRPPRGGNRGRGGPRPNTGSRKIEFDSEFDFESANAQFDKDEFEKEIKQKLTIGGDKAVNGEKDNSDNEQEVVEEDNDEEVYYDKSKSFFDNISCEATERAKGVSTRPNWREERKLNTETFGQSGFRRGGRGGMRGGYGYYNRGGGQYRGRGRGRGGQYHRGRGNYNNRGGGGGGRGGRPRSQGWVDYDFDYAAAGIERNNLNSAPAAAAKS